jgi:hypothetical protein
MGILLQVSDEIVATGGMDALLKLLGKFGARLFIDFLSVFALVRLVYFPVYKRRELFFTFFIFNVVIFLICFLLNKVELSMGAAFGLFAVFSMLRYRTEDISIKDMSYLFLVIAMGLISAVTKIKGANEYYEYLFLVVINFTIITLTYLLESKILLKKEAVKTVTYERIDLIHESKRQELIEDLESRLGLKINRITIQKYDFLKDSAQIKVYYFEV